MYKFGITKEESGATVVEYAIVMALVTVVAIGTLRPIGTHVAGVLGQISEALHETNANANGANAANAANAA